MNNSGAGPSSKAKSVAIPPSDMSFKPKSRMFQKDLRHMLYGFGDDINPLPETLDLVEDIVTEYVTNMVHKAQEHADGRGKLLTEDFLYLIRKDTPKLNRCIELLSLNDELERAKKNFDYDDEKFSLAD